MQAVMFMYKLTHLYYNWHRDTDWRNGHQLLSNFLHWIFYLNIFAQIWYSRFMNFMNYEFVKKGPKWPVLLFSTLLAVQTSLRLSLKYSMNIYRMQILEISPESGK